MDRILAGSLAQPRFSVVGLGTFAAIALILGMGGLYGVVSYLAAQRTHDIGIRFALGAQRRHVLSSVMSQGMRPVLACLLVGLAGCFALSRYLRSLLYEVSPTDPEVLLSVAGLLVLAALIACYFPARRASRMDPSAALKLD